ncbi:DUF3662 and FHA domain-containing protein [Corynebacterium aquatimens]|uniref:FHA domain-containing protein n=1 Tax=Corynebacterium aquatimens TaxID=1190508 RepID=A0A931GUC8_9CORY|nr:DUF3662 and FHA domain-containing protein [Corynebacterium aquatimens]MBG6122640.1 hypothetical protein [Corynebacterium aquatimens]WJY64822.1 FHA domain-containing protein FhaA [Corynebacterium aquatimens]
MAIMERLAKLDSAMQRGLDNGFAAVFGGRVVPAEIEEILKQEAQDSIVTNEYDELVVPNVYAVGVSKKDLTNLSQDTNLPSHLASQLTRYVRNQGWSLYGPAVVRVAEESGLRTGQLRVSSYIDDAPDVDSGFDVINSEAQEGSAMQFPPDSRMPHAPAQPTSGGGANVILILQDGSSRSYQVKEGSTILGRSNDADFRVPDTGVSRHHAEITWDGSVAVLVDLQSTNGTTVNDQQVDNWMLADGDVISMGHSTIEVRIVEPRQGQPAPAAQQAPAAPEGEIPEFWR